MKLGYNTNGFSNHRLEDTIEIVAELGYQSLALTVDNHCLPPQSSTQDLEQVRVALERHELDVVVETGARFLLDPRKKHFPTLLSSTSELRRKRVDFLKQCTNTVRELGGSVVSLWSGAAEETVSEEKNWKRLIPSLKEVLDHAADQNAVVGFEPEPGMFIDTMEKYSELIDRCENHPALKLTLDVGHLHCQQEFPIENHIRRWKDLIVNVHIEDMVAGVHDHLMFGEGEMEFSSILKAFSEIQYQGGLHVELSRHSHNAVEIARQSFEFLSKVKVNL